ncbi:AAA family ATPase [Nocardioides sp. LHD-245]|uniref:AAA family ATPase n=1 Tax=Nocardioides sp. LHD-245 TaxID=3051387 RepID=UPI0027DEC943|nr:AAA family ATPase [Nocardioides sp. LHD-245]
MTASELEQVETEASAPAPRLPPLVRSLEVVELFGRYSYRVLVPEGARTDRLVLFYGDNGKGKTTILRLLWHLLSPAADRHHRSRIAKIPFKNFLVHLEDGSSIEASRPAPVAGPYSIVVRDRSGQAISHGEWPTSKGALSDWDLDTLRANLSHLPKELKDEAERSASRLVYLEMLANLGARPYFLADDRNIYNDDLDETAKERRLREHAHWTRTEQSAEGVENSNVAAELQMSISRANEILRQMTIGGTQSGSANANAVYLDVITRLAAVQPEMGPQPYVLDSLKARIIELGERSRPYEELRLVPEFPDRRFYDTLELLADENAGIAEEVLVPYLSTIDARLDALEDAQSLISTFLTETNGFLNDKQMAFSPRTGLQILTADDRLMPLQLSSGERQLVLLLCNALLARQGSRLFLIDEPELSLNVKWQRRIVDSLLKVTNDAPVQFFIATHSIELLSSYKANVVRLESL